MDFSTIEAIVAHGFAVASINYCLSREAKYPAQIKDAKAAVRFLRANAARYPLDTNRFMAWGGSAGGKLASLLGTTGDVTTLEDVGLGNATFSSRVRLVVDWFGQIDFLTMDEQATALGCTLTTNLATSPESTLIGAAMQTVPEQTRQANPLLFRLMIQRFTISMVVLTAVFLIPKVRIFIKG